MKATIKFTTQPLEDKLRQAFASYSQLLEAQFVKEISTKQFSWPGATTRGSYNSRGKGRERVESPRDIIDSGFFKQSQQRSQLGPLQYRYTYTGYAAPILYGYRTRGGNQMPARDWITPALVKFPVAPFLKKYLNS